jgi:hypothetical protein
MLTVVSETTVTTPTVTKLFQRRGVAGQFSVQCTLIYPGEDPQIVEFVGSVYGGPVFMVTDTSETWVTQPGRFGTFGKAWVKRFYA